ncbi:nuclear transport factor 2 family protein [uncultured Amnibacterium sp.]|uniref:nuclear transport factor 2 family protein n=1 Tax=uncultured Amnibacterium sp. TaxID=1631851 RepID=UPI0035CC0721
MPSSPAPEATDPLQRLTDLEDIRALVSSFARSIDTKDQEQYAANFAEDGVLELPFGSRVGRASIAEMKGPPPGTHSHHLLGQIDVVLDGDIATATTYMLATHVFSPDSLSEKAHSGGWYEQELVRTGEGWRFATVKLVIRWADERPMIPTNPTEAGAIAS